MHPNMIIPTSTGIVIVLLNGGTVIPFLQRQFYLMENPFSAEVKSPPKVANITTINNAKNFYPLVPLSSGPPPPPDILFVVFEY